MPSHVERINSLAELQRIGVEWEAVGDNEVLIRCPVHDDNKPSVGLNTEKNVWRCRAAQCGARGDIVSLLAHFLQVERMIVITDLATRYDLEEIKIVSPVQVEKWHGSIWSEAGPLLTAIRERGITDEMIRIARIGYAKGRLSIPVYDIHHNIVNVRRYLPGAPGPEKMRNLPGFGKEHLYQSEQTQKFETIWICGGELKALLVGAMLNKHGIGAVSSTAGEGSWNVKWNSLLKGKRVFICMDIDSGGFAAARSIGNLLYRDVDDLRIIVLPLDKDRYPKGDVNDYVGREKATDADLLRCMEEAYEYEPSYAIEGEPTQADVITTNLASATNPAYVGRRIRFKATPIGIDEEPYLVPKQVRVHCDRNQKGCSHCPIFMMEANQATGAVDVTLRESSKHVLNFIGLPDANIPRALSTMLGIPACKSVRFSTLERTQIVEALLQPEFSIGELEREVNRAVYIVGQEPELNTVYIFTGILWEHPRNQKATLLITECEQTGDNLSTFTATAQDLESLKVFRPTDWSIEKLRERITAIYDDLSAHVTRIYGRMALHMAVDLTYHSVLGFTLKGKEVTGWMNTLIIGDTAQGKSETTDHIQRFYQLGGRAECKNASVAGLLGGVQQVGTRWFVSWGVIPRYDRRLVVLEEVKGTTIEVLSKLTDMRSRGVATIDKVIQRTARARTRLLFLSNPRSERPMSQYTYGIESIPELIGSPEDVRRFDVALCLDKREIEGASLVPPKVPHLLDPLLCRRLILWAWTRRQDQVQFEDEDQIFKCAEQLQEKFSGVMPLIDTTTTPMKIARIAAALAARTFSTTDDLETVVVRRCHVEAVVAWIQRIYESKAAGYAEFTTRYKAAFTMRDPSEVITTIMNSRYPRDFIAGLLTTDQVTEDDVASYMALPPDDVRLAMSTFVRKNALTRVVGQRRVYTKTTAFINLLKDLESHNEAANGNGSYKPRF